MPNSENPTKLANSLRSRLQSTFGVHVYFRETYQAANTTLVRFFDDRGVGGDLEGDYEPVLVGHEAGASSLLLAVSFKTRFVGGDYRLLSARIAASRASPGSARRAVMLRAEWDNQSLAEAGHGQPHWHLQASDDWTAVVDESMPPGLSGVSDAGVSAFEQLTQARFAPAPESPHIGATVAGMHLAMRAGWHEEPPGAHVHLFGVRHLIPWVVGTATYVRDQYRYALDRE